MKEDLKSGKGVIAGDNVSTRQLPLAADTYFVGMRLEYVAANDNYAVLAAGTLAAIYHGDDKDGVGEVLAAPGTRDCIVAGDIAASGIKDDAGDAVTLSEDEIAAYRDAGFFVKEY